MSGDTDTYKRQYQAKTDPEDGHEVIYFARPDLARYQPDPKNPAARVTDSTATHLGLGVWTIDVTWSTETGQKTGSPLSEPAIWELSGYEKIQRARFRDYEGKPIMSTSGGLFDDPPPVEDLFLPIFSGKKNIRPEFPGWLLSYTGAINQDPVRIRGITFAPKTLKAKILIGKPEKRDEIAFSVCSIDLTFNPDTWIHKQPNRHHIAYRYIEGVDPETEKNKKKIIANRIREVILVNGERPTEPQWLDKWGRWIKDPKEAIDKLLVLDFAMSPILPFANLPLT